MEQVVYGIHTGTFKHQVTKKESNTIKKFFGVDIDKPLKDETHFYGKGITKIWLQEIATKRGMKYYLFMQINFARVLGIGTHKIMAYSVANMKKVIKAVNKVLKILLIEDMNTKFQDWTVERFDPAFDIYEQHTPLLMQSLNNSLDLSNTRKKCERLPIPNKTPEQLKSESLQFGNDSYVYNGYAKLTEVLEKAEKNGRTVTQEEIEEVRYILRIERQNHADAVKKLLPHRTVGDLADDKVRADILKVMLDEVALFFGKGDFYSWKRIKEVFYPDHKADIDTIKNVMKQITLSSLEAAQEAYTKEISGIFDKLKIAPVGIEKDYGVDFIQGVYSRIVKEYPRPPDKRQYNSFPIPHQTKNDGRIGANITFYSVNDGKKTITVRGKSLEDYEEKVFDRLRRTYLVNRQYLKSDDAEKRDMLLKSADSIKRFYKAARTAAVRQDAERLIESSILYDEKKLLDPDNSS